MGGNSQMSIFNKLFGNNRTNFSALNVADSDIVAMADGKMIDITSVPDPMFANKVMGDSVAFSFKGNKTVICAPANGELSVLFPTGHAFGITMENDVFIRKC